MSAQLDKSTILVVEDELSVLRMLEEFFNMEFGSRAAYASTGREALELIKKRDIGFVVSDCHLGRGINGDRVVATAARKVGIGRTCFYTGLAGDYQNFITQYGIKVFDKPGNIVQLVSHVVQALQHPIQPYTPPTGAEDFSI